MKLWIFDLWRGYVQVDYIAVVADSEDEARQLLMKYDMRKQIVPFEDLSRSVRDDAEFPKTRTVHYYTNNYDKTKITFETWEQEYEYRYNHKVTSLLYMYDTCDFVAVDVDKLRKKGIVKKLEHNFIE